MKIFCVLFISVLIAIQSLAQEADSSSYKEFNLDKVGIIKQGVFFREYDHLDTTLDNFHYYWMSGYNAQFSVGNVGAAIESFFYREKNDNLIKWNNPFNTYYLNNSNVSFYDAKVPFTEVGYANGSKNEQFVNVSHNQNVNQFWNLGFDYRRLSSEGFYVRQRNLVTNARIHTNFTSRESKYRLFFTAFVNIAEVQENGGIVNDTLFTENVESNRKGIAVNLSDAKNNTDNRGLAINHSLKLLDFSDSLTKREIRLNHKSSYTWDYQRFDDSSPDSLYYDSYNIKYLYDRVEDVVNTWNLSNEFSFSLLSDSLYSIGLGTKNQAFWYNDTYVDTELIQTSIFTTSNFFLSKVFSINIEGEYTFSDFGKSNYSLGTTIHYNLLSNDKLELTLGGEKGKYTPSVNYLMYNSEYLKWNNQLKNIEYFNLCAKVVSRRHDLLFDVNFSSISDYTYIGSDLKPTQHGESISIVRFSLSKLFKIGPIGIKINGFYQLLEDDSPMRFPDFYTNSGLYYENKLFRKALELRVGADILYYSKYKTNGYLPLGRHFYLQDEVETGGYPYIDFYVAARIKKVRLFAKFSHLNSGLNGYDYFFVPHYPANDRQYRLGINWIFMN